MRAPRPADLTIAVTRPSARAARLVTHLQEAGFRTVVVPLIAIGAASDRGAALAAALHRLSEFDWVTVTSASAIEPMARLLPQAPHGSARWAAVGPATAARLAELGATVDLVPSRHDARGLAEEFPAAAQRGGHVLVVQAEAPRLDLSAPLAAKGWSVERAAAYRTVPTQPTGEQLEQLRSADLVTLSSPSAAANLARLGLREAPVVCIGDVTAGAAREHGLDVRGVAAQHGADAFARAVMTAVGWSP